MVLNFSDLLTVVPGLHGDKGEFELRQMRSPHKPGYVRTLSQRTEASVIRLPVPHQLGALVGGLRPPLAVAMGIVENTQDMPLLH